MNRIFKYLICSIILFSCKQNREIPTEDFNSQVEQVKLEQKKEFEREVDYNSLFTNNPKYIAEDFDFPVTKPNIMGARNLNTKMFGTNNHLANESNEFDKEYFDKPIYAIGNGYVSEVKEYNNNWGNVIRIVHLLDENLYESIYAHCNTMIVKPNQFVKKGEQIGSIITCNKQYHTHLYFEIRDSLGLDMDRDYSKTSKGYIDPKEFIKKTKKLNGKTSSF